MSPALGRGLRKGLRTVLQLAAAGGLTVLIEAFADLAPNWKAVILAFNTVVLAAAQNTLEAARVIPVLLPTPAIPPPA